MDLNRCLHGKRRFNICPACDMPKLHTWDGGLTYNTGGFGIEDANWLISLLKPEFENAIETGAGLSTLLFQSRGLVTTSVVNDESLIARMEEYRNHHEFFDDWKVYFGLSGDELPKIEGVFDVGLIDGGHGFPIPMIDFYYIFRNLKKNGVLIIDDAQLYAPRTLVKNLNENTKYFELQSISPSLKAYAFKKLVDDTHLPDFLALPRDAKYAYSIEEIDAKLFQLKHAITNFKNGY